MNSRAVFLCAALIAAATTAILAQTEGSAHKHSQQHHNSDRLPQQGGQAAFAAIQEIVALLNADPTTNWDQVDVGLLREHLVDMEEVIMRAQAQTKPLSDGVEILIAGSGRTWQAIQRMVPAHAIELDKLADWQAIAAPAGDRLRLTVTSEDQRQVARIQALGLFGLMATGTHHRRHHLAIASGKMAH